MKKAMRRKRKRRKRTIYNKSHLVFWKQFSKIKYKNQDYLTVATFKLLQVQSYCEDSYRWNVKEL